MLSVVEADEHGVCVVAFYQADGEKGIVSFLSAFQADADEKCVVLFCLSCNSLGSLLQWGLLGGRFSVKHGDEYCLVAFYGAHGDGVCVVVFCFPV